VALALKEYAPDLGIAFSGAEDVVLIDMAVKGGVPFKVFSLDTGRLHPETYQYIEKVRRHYGITIEAVFPQPDAVQSWCGEGLFSFYRTAKECCGSARWSRCNARCAAARLDHRPAPRSEPAPAPRYRWCRSTRHSVRTRSAGEVQPAGQLDLAAGVELHPRQRRSLQCVA
jgi:hypothetical protein